MIKMEKEKVFEIIDKWHTSECKNECDPKSHMKIVTGKEIEELKEELKKLEED